MRLLTLLMLAILLPATAFADQPPTPLTSTTVETIPHFDTLSGAQFEALSNLYSATPPCDKRLAYYLRLPKGWLKTSSERTVDYGDKPDPCHWRSDVLGLIAQYVSPDTTSTRIMSTVLIQAIKLNHDITLKDQMLTFIQQREEYGADYKILGVNDNSDTEIEVLYSFYRKGISFVVRAVAEINGPRIMLASYVVPEERWDTEKAMQERVVHSFRPLNRALILPHK